MRCRKDGTPYFCLCTIYLRGKSGTLPVPTAISSAVERAVRFVNPDAVVTRLPLTPERVLSLLHP